MEKDRTWQAEEVNTAADIRRAFYEAKAEQLKKNYNPAARHRDPRIWEAAAQRCIALGADPYSFVRAAFLYNSIPGGPWPHQMATRAADRWYQEYFQLHGIDGLTKQDIYQNEIKHLITNAQLAMLGQKNSSPREFLLDQFTSLDAIPAFVRVILMPSEPQVVDRWGPVAFNEVMGNQRLLHVLHELECDRALEVLNQFRKRR